MDEVPSRRQLLKQCAAGMAFFGGPVATAQEPSPRPDATRQRLEALISGYQSAQMIHVAATLKIADLLDQGPRTTAELALSTGTHEDSLYRLMRTLASLGIFSEEDGRRFKLNAMAELLRSGVPGSVRVSAEIAGAEWMWRPWGALLGSVKTGQTAFDRVYGQGTFDWFATHPEAGRLFDAGQAQVTAASASAVMAAYDFSRAKSIVDIGGGDGTLLAAALRASASARGVLMDLPNVVAGARKTFDATLVARTEFVAGDFFKAVPAGGDIYLMKSILHDWNDADCQRILSTVRRAVPAAARVVVAEDLVCGPNQPCPAKPRDINMLVRTGGRNRTEQEYRAVLARGGFAVARVIPTSSTLYLIEAAPA